MALSVAEQVGLLDYIEPVVVAKIESLIGHPLMRRVDGLGGWERLMGLMEAEYREFVETLEITEPSRRYVRLNGGSVMVAGEGADVLVFAAAIRAVVWSQGRTSEQQEKYFEYLRWLRVIDEVDGLGLIAVAVGVIKHKNDAFNYPYWAFQEIPEESDEEVLIRYAHTVTGLKALRRSDGDGLLLPEILVGAGFDDGRKTDPVYVHGFLRAVAGGV